MKYSFWVTILMVLLVIFLVWSGKDSNGISTTIIVAVLGYWFGQSTINNQ